jgi:uncharacterized protein
MKEDDFEWDDAKAAQNWANHGVSFEAARPAFDDPFTVVRENQRRDYGEDRYVLCSAWSKATSLPSSTRNAARGSGSSRGRLAEPRERRRYHEENR